MVLSAALYSKPPGTNDADNQSLSHPGHYYHLRSRNAYLPQICHYYSTTAITTTICSLIPPIPTACRTRRKKRLSFGGYQRPGRRPVLLVLLISFGLNSSGLAWRRALFQQPYHGHPQKSNKGRSHTVSIPREPGQPLLRGISWAFGPSRPSLSLRRFRYRAARETLISSQTHVGRWTQASVVTSAALVAS